MTSEGPRDVRMRGFRERASVASVQAWVDARPDVVGSEKVGLHGAWDRVLVEDLTSACDVPAFSRAAMDGWAVRGEDTFGASETSPIELHVVGLALPGQSAQVEVGRGQAVRIMTGAPLPAGADAVLRAEDGDERGERLQVRGVAPPKRHVGQAGEDVRRGQRLLEAGRRLRPQDVALAASVGQATLRVKQRPRVAIFATGDELLAAGEAPRDEHIVDSNTPMLDALVRRDGGEVVAADRLRDDRERIKRALSWVKADVILVSGGSSVGQEDHAPGIVAEEGELAIHGVALRPAAPTGAGLLSERPVFLLPGNPVSCLSAYDLFAGRAVRRFAGRAPEWPYRATRLPLRAKISSALGRVDYVRVRVGEDGVEPLMSRGASILSSTTEADGFLLVAEGSEGYPPGHVVEVFLYDAV